jgi:hypothetical protein
VEINRHANQKSNTGTGKGSNVLNYRLKHLSTGLPMPAPAKKKMDKQTITEKLQKHIEHLFMI